MEATESKKKKKKPKKPKKVTYKGNGNNGNHGRVPLKISTKCIASDDTLLAQIKANADRGLAEFIPFPNKHSGVICLVGSGPSVRGQLDEILKQKKKGRLIVALKGAHDFLIENGIMPDWCVMLDPQEKIVNCVQKHNREVTYFIASQCHPSVFELLKERYVILWHALSGIGEAEILEGRVLMGGGTTTGLRTLNMIYQMGYRKAHLFGFDSSVTIEDGEQYKRINIHSEKGMDKPNRVIDVWVGNNCYWTNPAMAAQAQEFQQSMAVLKGMKVNLHGEGLIPGLWRHHIGMGGDGWFED